MAGRRLRDSVKATLIMKGNGEFNNVTVVIAGLTNSYSQYVSTFEEYQIQRYEVFPHTTHLFHVMMIERYCQKIKNQFSYKPD